MKWLATVDNGTSIETCPYFARAITLVASSVMALFWSHAALVVVRVGWARGIRLGIWEGLGAVSWIMLWDPIGAWELGPTTR